MANAQLFQSLKGKFMPLANTVNAAMAPAYAFSPCHQPAQYAATGCLNANYHAKTAIYCRERGYMKDMPALLTYVLAGKDSQQLTPAFHQQISNGKMQRPDAAVMAFEQDVVRCDLNPHNSVMSNAARLAAIGGVGTNCSAPLARMYRDQVKDDLVVFVSDNESWIDARRSGATATMREWVEFKRRNPQARLVCIGIAPSATTQAAEPDDILNIGGFSDAVFKLMAAFAAGQLGARQWVGEIESVALGER